MQGRDGAICSLFHHVIPVPHPVQFLIRTHSAAAMAICQIVLPVFTERTQKFVVADVIRTKQFFIGLPGWHDQIIPAQVPVGRFLHSTTAIFTARYMLVTSAHDNTPSMIPSCKIIWNDSKIYACHKIFPSTCSKNCKNPSSTATCSNSGSGRS